LGQRAFRLNPHHVEAFKLARFGLVAGADRPDWDRMWSGKSVVEL
jgi:hypothetical protein